MAVRPISSAPSRSPAAGASIPRVRCSSSSAHTRVLCTASVTDGVPRWRKGSGLGWVTCEYAMLPRATNTRTDRESVKGRIGGRTHEISRLIGRSLRACMDLKAIGENSVVIDCDVLQADGGTRTAAITGAYVALHDAVTWMAGRRMLAGKPAEAVHRSVAAVSVGIVGGEPRARPLLRRGREGRCGHEHRLHRGRRLRRGAGHGRGRRLLPRRAQHAARPGRGRLRDLADLQRHGARARHARTRAS